MADDSDNGTLVPADVLTRKRRGRAHAVRAFTESMRRLSKGELRRAAAEYPERDYWRPWLRGECEGSERPCAFVACRHHLALDVVEVRGSIKYNFPDLDVGQMVETCSLDVAARGGVTLEEVAVLMNLTRERVRQIEDMALAKFQRRASMFRLGPESVE